MFSYNVAIIRMENDEVKKKGQDFTYSGQVKTNFLFPLVELILRHMPGH